jgi:hemerythrin superfamily protein
VTSTQLAGGRDVVDFLLTQHERIKELFEQVLATSGDERRETFTALRRLLAVHETAEEEVVHPRARHLLANGDEIVDKRLEEENDGKRVLASLEHLDVDSSLFEEKLRKLQNAVLEHAAAEEEHEFAQLADQLDADQLAMMQRAVRLAERMAPTRPHPGVESAPANLLGGPFAMMMDRVRDVLTGKTTDEGDL